MRFWILCPNKNYVRAVRIAAENLTKIKLPVDVRILWGSDFNRKFSWCANAIKARFLLVTCGVINWIL